jgi:hypothetical protein
VEQLGLDALLPRPALVHHRHIDPSPGTHLEHVTRRNPRLRQTVLHQQRAEVAGVGAIRLRSLLATPQRGGIRRLRQVRLPPGPLQLLDHEPPPGAPLGGKHRLLAPETRQPLPQLTPGSRHHPTHLHLTGLQVEMVIGDLSPMHIQAAYDQHQGPPSKASTLEGPTQHTSVLEPEGAPHMSSVRTSLRLEHPFAS